jgi:uncharacterized protein (TIRG00374 family)
MKRLLKLLVSGLLVSFAIYLLDVQTIIQTVKAGSATSFIIAVILNILSFLIMGFRWHLLVAPAITRPTSAHMAIYLKGAFLNTFTPANLGGDAYRLAALSKEMGADGGMVRLLLRERIIGLYGYVIVFALAYIFVVQSLDINTALIQNPYNYGVLLALGLFLLPFISRWLRERFVQLARHIIGKERLPGLEGWAEAAVGLLSLKGMLPLMLLTIGGIFLWVASIKVIGGGFGVSIPLAHLAVVATLVEIIRLVPLTIQGIGLREGVFAYLLVFLGHGAEQCYAVGTIGYLALSVAIILCGPLGHVIMRRERAGVHFGRTEERQE